MATEYGSFTAFIENPADIEVLHSVAKQLNIKNYEVLEGGVKEAVEVYQGKKAPAYLIIDISKSDLPVSDMSRLYEVCSPDVSIIVIGLKNEVSLYRDLTRLGVYEYLLSPLFPEILEPLLKAMLTGKGKEAISSTKTGKIITCMGSRGGAGTTFIASNLAAMLAGEKLRRVVLLDLDPYFGTLSLNFDLKASVRLRDAFENPARIDQVFIERLLTPINERLFILGSEEPLDAKIHYNIEALEEILKYLAKQFHYVIIDIPHTFNDLISVMFKKANLFLLFTEPTVSGLRDTGRILHFVHKEGAARRCIITLNKKGQYGKNEIKKDAFEAALKNKVDHVIGYDTDVPMDCLNQGKMLVNEQNATADSIRNIMLDILGAPQTQEKTGWFKKLF